VSGHSFPTRWTPCLLAIAALLAPAAARADLVAYWALDSNAADLSGHGHDGTLRTVDGPLPAFTSDVAAPLAGPQATALCFADENDYVALNMSYNGLGTVPAFTAAAWFRTSFSTDNPDNPDVEADNWALIDFDRSEYFNLFVRSKDGKIGFSTSTGGPENIHDQVGDTAGLHDGVWHHVAVVYDGTDKRIYLDGNLDGTAVNAHGGQALGSELPRFGILGDGSEAETFDGDRNDFYYDGCLDDAAIWDRALSDTEIALLASGARSPLTVPEPATIAVLLAAPLAATRRRRR
jgi:hypothetical protein